MNFLVLIPARDGSTRIKNKNFKKIKGKHLIEYTYKSLEFLKDKKNFKLVLSSDSKKIISFTEKKYNFINIQKRSKKLATNKSEISELLIHLKKINYFEGFDYLVLLSPCSPMRGIKDIKNFFLKLTKDMPECLISITDVEKPLDWSLKLNNNGYLKKIFDDSTKLSSKTFIPNGAFYGFSLKKKDINFKNFYNNKVKYFYMDRSRSLDIDNISDLKLFRLMSKRK